MNLPEPLTRQVGPLPVWGWLVAGVGGFLAYRYLTGGGSGDAVTIGDLNGGALGDGFDDSGDGGVSGGGDGATHEPIPVPGTPGNNGTSRMILTVKGRLPFQESGNLGHVAGHIPADAGSFYVERVKKGDGYYYRILGRVREGGIIDTSIARRGQLIRDRAELRKLFTITRTPATQAA